MKRDFNDPRWVKTRKAVFVRDKFTCQYPGCKAKNKKIEAHHIRRVADHPELEFVADNIITLCLDHHKHVTGREAQFAPILTKAVQQGKGTSDGAMAALMARFGV